MYMYLYIHIQLSDAFGWSSYRLQTPPWPVTISRTSMRHIMKYDAMIDIVTLWLFNIAIERWKMTHL